MGVKKHFFWSIMGFIGAILLFSACISQNAGAMAQEYEPGNNTSGINSSPVVLMRESSLQTP